MQNLKHKSQDKKLLGDVVEKIVDDWRVQKFLMDNQEWGKMKDTAGYWNVCFQSNSKMINS